jgi:exfoliative toxin A/B
LNSFLKKLPLPVSGLMLGLAALGNLIKDYGDIYRNILGLISGTIFLMLILKVVIFPRCIKEGLDNPVVGGVMATFPMGMMILSTYLVPYSKTLSFGLWISGVILHLILIMAFSLKYILKFDIKKVFTTYYIVYVGIVAGSVSAPAHNMLELGKLLFWFGFISYVVILPLVLYRIFIVKEIPAPALPTLVIQAAPGSLCLAGYLSTFQEKSPTIVVLLLILASINILIALAYLPKLIAGKFVPAFSAFTFPIVISGIAMKLTNGFFMKSGNQIQVLKPAASILEIMSLILVLFVLLSYIKFMALPVDSVTTPKKA